MRIGLLVIALSLSAFAGITGKITGRVTAGESGEALIGCNVLVEGTYLGAATDEKGEFIILNVPPGRHTVVANMIGYVTQRMPEVEVKIDLTTELDFVLTVAAIQGEAVVVTYDRPVITKDRTSSEVQISDEQIEELPVQDVGDILELQSGITKDAGGGIHVRGGRGSEVVYWIDGIPVTDGYDGSAAVGVDKNSIQELQVISGTFNAEYGQAMSGIVNIVTKTGGTELKGSVEVYGGDYVPDDDGIFTELGSFTPLAKNNISASLSGPFFSDKLRFYISGNSFHKDGYFTGYNFFNADGTTGDSSVVFMDWSDSWSIHGKLTYMLSQNINLTLNVLNNGSEYQNYNHFFKWAPEGRIRQFDEGYTRTLSLNHTLSSSSYYTVKLSQTQSAYRNYRFEDPLDSNYVDPELTNVPTVSFAIGGNDLGHFYRESKSTLLKLDYSSQVNDRHLLQTGVEYRLHDIYEEGFGIISKTDEFGVEIEPFEPDTLGVSTPSHSLYNEDPVEFSAYIQDKIEYEKFIVNVGLRYDYFQANGNILADPEDPNIYNPFKQEHVDMTLAEREAVWYKASEAKTSLSPRLGLAFPITDQGVIHFSYGHFFQIPNFSFLYQNPGFKVPTTGGTHGIYGNADLDPQKTVMYELGLQQQLNADINFELTLFYRDIRDWVSTGAPIQTSLPGVTYVTWINRDYANSRGVILSYDHSLSDYLFFNAEYTFQIAEGSNSDPAQEYNALLGGNEATKIITPLNWDQRHTLNGALSFDSKRGFKASFLGRYGSGYPYTPYIGTSSRTGLSVSNAITTNSRRIQPTYEMDMKLSYSTDLLDRNLLFYVTVNNLLDIRNPNSVWADTGQPDKTFLISNVSRDDLSWNTVEEFILFPYWYSAPREILWGIKISL